MCFECIRIGLDLEGSLDTVLRIGAFAVVGFSAVITANVPAHHSAFGNPAATKLNDCKVWCWDDTKPGLERASRYLARFPYPK